MLCNSTEPVPSNHNLWYSSKGSVLLTCHLIKSPQRQEVQQMTCSCVVMYLRNRHKSFAAGAFTPLMQQIMHTTDQVPFRVNYRGRGKLAVPTVESIISNIHFEVLLSLLCSHLSPMGEMVVRTVSILLAVTDLDQVL